MATVWQISQMERTLDDNGVIVAHWRANASETVGTGDDAVTYSATNYGTCGFTPDPSSSDWVDYDSITENLALSWCFGSGVDKDAIEASLAANLDLQQNPTKASGVPWA
jgi:hypothetical protein